MKGRSVKNSYTGVVDGMPELPGTSEGEGAAFSPTEDTPSAFVLAVCIAGTSGGSETIILVALASEPTGAIGTGLEVTPAIVDVVELSIEDGCSTEVPVAVVGTLELEFISECAPSTADFSACSRANWSTWARISLTGGKII